MLAVYDHIPGYCYILDGFISYVFCKINKIDMQNINAYSIRRYTITAKKGLKNSLRIVRFTRKAFVYIRMKLLCAAMPHELSYTQGVLDNFAIEYIDYTSQTCLLHSLHTKNTYLGAAIGIGPIYIEECLDELARHFYISDVTLVGIAGAASSSLSMYDIIVGKMCYLIKQQQIIAIQCADESMKDIVTMLKSRNYSSQIGNLLTVGREVLSNLDYKQYCPESLRHTVAALDMEAGIVARWTKVREIPCNVIKIISDFLPLNRSEQVDRSKIIKAPQFLQSLRYSQRISNEILNYFDSK